MRPQLTFLRPHGQPTEIRFWTNILCDVASGCWLWQGDRSWGRRPQNGGYGMLYVSRQYRVLERTPTRQVVEILEARRVMAHRYAWELLVGPIPDGMILCHRCDTPGCVRPEHLFLGSHQDNTDDKMAKGRHGFGPLPHYTGEAWHARYAGRRQRKGEQLWNAKLTADQVREIRQRHAAGETLKALGVAYGVALSLVGRIAQRKAWKHIP